MKDITEEEIEAIEEYLEFDDKQVKALTNLKKAFTRCRKLGIDFWDNYGSFTAYPSRKMTCPVPEVTDECDFNYEQGNYAIQCCMYIREAGNTAGNSDDICSFNLLGKTLGEIMKGYYDMEGD